MTDCVPKMPLVDCMKDFLQHKDKLDEVERQGTCTYATDEESYDEEFRNLRELSLSYRTDNVYTSDEAMRSGNTSKNRFKDIVPFDYTRVKLKTLAEGSTSDYINASFIKGAIGDQMYIAAQGPLPKTVNDFWQMLWENDVKVVLMMCSEYEGSPPKLKCQRYWPNSTEEELQFGNIRVTLEKEEKTSYKEHLIRHLVAKMDNTSRRIVQFHYLEWPDAGVPRGIPGVLDLLERLRSEQPFDAKKTPPVLFHCSAGCGRTGSMIVIDYVISLLKYGKLTENFKLYDLIVDFRRQRMAIVQALEQYVFVHEVIAALFKRQLEDIEGRVYSNTIKPKVEPRTEASGGFKSGVYSVPPNNGPVGRSSMNEKRVKASNSTTKPKQRSDSNTDLTNEKTQGPFPASPTSMKPGAAGPKPPLPRRPDSLPRQVSCEYEITDTLKKEFNNSATIVYETVDEIGSSGKTSGSNSGSRTGSSSSGGNVTVVYEDSIRTPTEEGPKRKPNIINAPIMYKGINISYPNRFSKKPRGKRPFRLASGTTKAF